MKAKPKEVNAQQLAQKVRECRDLAREIVSENEEFLTQRETTLARKLEDDIFQAKKTAQSIRLVPE